MEWLPGPGEILQLSVFLTVPLFWSLLFDGGLQWVWHPAKCLRLAATLEAVIMACRCLATQASASPRCTDIVFLSKGCRDRDIISPVGPLSVSSGYFGHGIQSVDVLHCVVTFYSAQCYKYIGAVVHCTAGNVQCPVYIYSLIVHHAAWVNIIMEFCNVLYLFVQ